MAALLVAYLLEASIAEDAGRLDRSQWAGGPSAPAVSHASPRRALAGLRDGQPAPSVVVGAALAHRVTDAEAQRTLATHEIAGARAEVPNGLCVDAVAVRPVGFVHLDGPPRHDLVWVNPFAERAEKGHVSQPVAHVPVVELVGLTETAHPVDVKRVHAAELAGWQRPLLADLRRGEDLVTLGSHLDIGKGQSALRGGLVGNAAAGVEFPRRTV
mmetsp:Transcript_11584/g.26423  ORF Transcript_11584/g.26423 Transcript_11584/m.26423 type:complete len:214 (-) Transcript_11584:569-1210(-)